MAMGNAAAKRFYTPGPESIGHEVRSGAYGGLVGQMISEIDARLVQSVAAPSAEPTEDFIHKISVVGGYVGLAAGFAAAAAGLLLIL